jgi:hypothetical protein
VREILRLCGFARILISIQCDLKTQRALRKSLCPLRLNPKTPPGVNLIPGSLIEVHNIHHQLSVISQKGSGNIVTHLVELRNNICCLLLTGKFTASRNSNFVLFST